MTDPQRPCLAKIELWNLNSFMGVIVPMETGVVYTNQTGGTGCYHPEVEGLFIPLNSHDARRRILKDPLLDAWTDWAVDISPKRIKLFLEVFELEHIFSAPKELPEGSWGEAWVPVVIRKNRNEYTELLGAFVNKTVILTYPNSD